ncbi:ATP-binding protein [Paraliomyxa miuraensis]|uniref:HD domain-containing protein n=1 Tax=Paraliomyxa miuraensis TaxID=376150 RepID=UPI00224CBBF5|nr:ATP-binding protein [Paraliomyxa miuraensis]MCX4239102.1 ATP-binding protein [Paraliomyxa miuraensis]
MADLVVHEGDINPSEAFVLGIVFMLHDLGNTRISHGPDRDSWKSSLEYRAFRKQVERSSPGAGREDIERRTNFLFLRSVHAKRVEDIAVREWSTGNGHEFEYLIESHALRQAFGEWIGKICRSHNDDISSVITEFGHIGRIAPPPDFPQHWKVDLLKIACLLRACDAMHVDYRRASAFERSLRSALMPESELHWTFQRKLSLPTLEESGLIKYTSVSSFEQADAAAWWTCYDYLRMVDQELRECHSVLRSERNITLKAHGVRGAGVPSALAKTIQCKGWIPLNARVTVEDPTSLARMLGGTVLYGKKPEVAIREIVQNARDAVVAYRVITRTSEDWGEIRIVSEPQPDDRFKISISDNGIGMTYRVISSYLLSFGRSLWRDPYLAESMPSLAASDFEAVGRFGIGWFSVFLMSNHVRIITRHYEAAPSDTLVLEMDEGVASRPVLRLAGASEILHQPGTRIEILDIDTDTWHSTIGSASGFVYGAAKLCPALDVDLIVEEVGTDRLMLKASDWEHIDSELLMLRLLGLRNFDELTRPDYARSVASRMMPLRNDNGEIVGRLALALYGFQGDRFFNNAPNLVVDGGLASGSLGMDVAGVLFGSSSSVVRDSAHTYESASSFLEWLGRQVEMGPLGEWKPQIFAFLCHTLGRSDLEGASVAYTSEGPVTVEQLTAWVHGRERVILSFDIRLNSQIREGVVSCPLYEFSTGWLSDRLRETRDVRMDLPSERLNEIANRISALALASILRAWGADISKDEEVDVARYLTGKLQRILYPIRQGELRQLGPVFVLVKSEALEILSSRPASDEGDVVKQTDVDQ